MAKNAHARPHVFSLLSSWMFWVIAILLLMVCGFLLTQTKPSQVALPLIKPFNTASLTPKLNLALKTVHETKLYSLKVDPPIEGYKVISTSAKQGDTLAKIFNRLGLSPKQLYQVTHTTPSCAVLSSMKPGQRLIFRLDGQHIEQLTLPLSPIKSFVISSHPQGYQAQLIEKETQKTYQVVSGTIHGSLYATAKQQQIPSSLVQQFITIFSRDHDFKRQIKSGDQFSILYKATLVNDIPVETSDIYAASYTSKGTKHEAIRYTDKRGASHYYTPEGLSLVRGYDRYPIRFTHISSPFSLSRYHPVLHYKRPHYGIDLAAPMGTPIHAIGDGYIVQITRSTNGYGNMIKMEHNASYSTIYAHLLRFEKGMYRGKFIKRGQVIGYVGQSGLASGPHCHFEFHVHHHPQNPKTIALPHADPVPKKEMNAFKLNVHKYLYALQHGHLPINRHNVEQKELTG